MPFMPLMWSFAGVPGVHAPDREEMELGAGFSLLKRNKAFMDARTPALMNEQEYKEEGNCGWYLVFKTHWKDDQPVPDCSELQNGLISFQIIKPTRTSGWLFLCEQSMEGSLLRLNTTERRPPMESGRWARMRAFDNEFLAQLPAMILRVTQTMRGISAERKNAIILLQLALEHMHPLITGLIHVMGIEAIFDSSNRTDFRDKLCDCLGATTLAFPDWNSPEMSQPKYTVEELAIPLYMLRNKLAHGADLRKAATDKSTPVDLVKKVELIPELKPQAHAFLLSEAACYLHCQVLQKVL